MTDKTKDEGPKTAQPDPDKMFRSQVNLQDFARGLAQLPQLGELLRYAGLQDARTMAGVRITSSRLDALRAKAVGDPRAEARAKQAEAHAAHLARVAKREESRARPEESILGPLTKIAGNFRLVGKVLDKSGEPVPNATIEISGENTGVIFKAQTDESGVYDLSVPVGKEKDKADDGEPFRKRVLKEGKILQDGLMGLVKDGTLARRILTVPLGELLDDLAAPIATERPKKPVKTPPRRSPKAK